MSISYIKVDDEEFEKGMEIEKEITPRWRIVSDSTYAKRVISNLSRNPRFYSNVIRLRERE